MPLILPAKPLLFALVAALAPLPAYAVGCAGQDLLADLAPEDAGALDTAVGAAPYPVGNLWRAVKGDVTIHLLGTMHLHDPRMEAVMDRVGGLVDAADTLYVEITEADMAELEAKMARDPALLFVTDGPTLPELLSAEEWRLLSDELRARQIPPFLGSKFRPWYVATLLALPGCAMGEILEDRLGLDQMVMARAAAAGVPSASLEPYDTVFQLFGQIPEAEQIDMIRISLPFASQAENQFETMVESYFREEHRKIWEFTRLQAMDIPGEDPAEMAREFDAMEALLLTGRNAHWMEELLPLDPGAQVVVAVGAAHLSGPGGLLDLLEGQGFALERLPF